MILGNCPYEDCDDALMIPIADLPLPRFQRHKCEECKRTIWTLHSRITPESYTEEGFKERFDVDEATKHITEKTPPTHIK